MQRNLFITVPLELFNDILQLINFIYYILYICYVHTVYNLLHFFTSFLCKVLYVVGKNYSYTE